MKRSEFLNRLVSHYWSASDLRRIKKGMGTEDFEAIDWTEQAALYFVCDNLDDCIRIFSHKDFPRGK